MMIEVEVVAFVSGGNHSESGGNSGNKGEDGGGSSDDTSGDKVMVVDE